MPPFGEGVSSLKICMARRGWYAPFVFWQVVWELCVALCGWYVCVLFLKFVLAWDVPNFRSRIRVWLRVFRGWYASFQVWKVDVEVVWASS